ncbi:hypothetical protein LCGC14_2611080, partial [marine sediment metagenome]
MPEYEVVVGPAETRSTHHVSLIAEDGTEIGLILCDSSGDRLSTAIARSNLQTTPVKTTSGDSKYSDGEPPFVVSAQQSWAAGIGQERFEDNKTKYHTGCRIQTVAGKVMLGPREHFTYGFSPVVIEQPPAGHYFYDQGRIGRIRWTQSSEPNMISTKFTVGAEDVDIDELYMFGKPIGTATGPDEDDDNSHCINWVLRANDAGGSEPGTELTTGVAWMGSTYADNIMRWHATLESGTYTCAATTTYWLSMYPNSNATDSTCIEVGFHLDPDANPGDSKATSVISDDLGSNWGSYPDSDYQLMFRLEEHAAVAGTPGWWWFYRNQLYWLSRPNTGAPRLLMNGWRGVCDVNGAEMTKLLDATQTGWADDAAVGAMVWVFAGPGSDEELPFRQVIASESGELTVASSWLRAHTEDSEYVVLGSDQFFEVTQTIPHPPTGKPCIG